MTDKEAKIKTDAVFEAIKKASTVQQIDALISDELATNRMNAESYPYLQLNISREEVEELQKSGILNEMGNLSSDFSKRADLSPINKLLYSVLWKNGDLKKIKHIVQGIMNSEVHSFEKEDGLVFYQFGKFLTKKEEPIIDQHVLRAFSVYQTSNLEEVVKLRSKGTVTKKDKPLIEDYKKWLRSDELTPELKKQNDYSYHIDQLLFALGKTIKLRKKSNGKKS